MAAPTEQAAGPNIADLSLRRNERGFVVGGVGSGKSTLMDLLGADFVHRYARLGAWRLILDSKPRYKTEQTVDGRGTRRLYRGWSHGQTIPGSVLVTDPEDLDFAYRQGARTVIMQCETQAELPRLIAGASQFLKLSKASRPQLLQVDETLDFFHSNGAPRGGSDAIIRVSRAGRERGSAALMGAQRTKGMPTTLMEEMMRLYCFRIDFRADARRLQEMGAPEFPIPTRPHEFYYWTKHDYESVWGPYRLELG